MRRIEKEFLTPLTRGNIFTSNIYFIATNKRRIKQEMYTNLEVTREIYFARIKFYRIFDNT